jgi:hypothetical protein
VLRDEQRPAEPHLGYLAGILYAEFHIEERLDLAGENCSEFLPGEELQAAPEIL